LLLNILKVRVIVDNKEIYPLQTDDPVVIEVKENHTNIVVTDGFHYTKPIKLTYKRPSYYHFKVICAIDDFQLLGCIFTLALFYLLGFLTGVFFIKILSFLPIIYLLFAYYIDRKSFIQIRQDSHVRKSDSNR
jgi:hypothetical protein